MIDHDHRDRRYVHFTNRAETLWATASATSFDIAWPVGRPRCFGFEIFNLGLSGMVRVHRWQLSWGFTQPWNRYCYLADRQMERVRWIVGGSK